MNSWDYEQVRVPKEHILTPEQEVIMKSSRIALCLLVVLAVATVKIIKADPIHDTGLRVSCQCNTYPANWPVVGLFHSSQWGSSALRLFSVKPGDKASVDAGMSQCEQLLDLMQRLDVCPKP